MSCGGLHCAGCGGGGAGLGLVALAGFEGAEWLAENIIAVAAVTVTCAVLAVVAAIALGRWADRRDARRREAWQPLYLRAVPEVSPSVASQIARHAERPALGFRDLHLTINGQPTTEQAEVIRQALGRN